MTSEEVSVAGLRCRVIDGLDEGEAAKVLVILNHGFGASGDDLVDIGFWLIESEDTIRANCRLVFPEAPIDLAMVGMPGARAWWPINMEALAEINQTRDYDQLTKLTPDGMLSASQQLFDAVRLLQSRFSLEDRATVIGGFSQGAMCTTDVVLRKGMNPAIMALFSGTLLCREDWTQMANDHPGCDVFQSHGRQDMLLPFQPAAQLSQMLFDAGFKTEFHEFQGGHTIPMSVLQQFAQSLKALCSSCE